MSFSKYLNEGVNVSFDFDDTLRINALDVYGKNFPRKKYINLLKGHLSKGDNVVILTSRDNNETMLKDIQLFLKQQNIKPLKIIFTNGKPKLPFAKEHNISIHYDDDQEELKPLASFGIKVIDSDDKELKQFYDKYFLDLNS